MNAAEPSLDAALDPAQRARRQAQVVAALEPLLPRGALLWQREEVVPYECDGLTAYRQHPLVVALPETESQVAAVLRACHALEIPVVAPKARVHRFVQPCNRLILQVKLPPVNHMERY